ncbi:MAG: MFS transporter [bacterium]|nr:MFS transporter [bacterium]
MTPRATGSTSRSLPYHELPPIYHRWKWRVLLGFSGFYLFLYMGRFNLWPVSPLVKQDLQIDHYTLGWINALLLWGFMIGDLVHGRLAELYGLRLWVMLGAIATTICNWVASLSSSVSALAITWLINGFVNAACWSPGISLIAQWWPRRERGQAIGMVGMSAGGAMLLMWLVTGWVGQQFGWRAAFRYPPLLIACSGIAFFLIVRDRPSDVGLPEYQEDDPLSASAEASGAGHLDGFGPYKQLLSNKQFLLASQVKGIENIARYGLTTWTPLYYVEAAGLDIKTSILFTMALPLGYLVAPLCAGLVSDRLLHSARRPMVMLSAAVSAIALVGIAIIPPSSVYIGAMLLLIGGFAMSLSPMAAMAVDIAGRHLSGTASGILDAHGYFYAGLQAVAFGILLDMSGSPWPLVFLFMAGSRVLCGVLIFFVKV